MSFSQWYIRCRDFFAYWNIPIFIHGSTLLQAVRGKGLDIRHSFDRELNFGIRAEDLSQQLLWEMKKEFPYVLAEGDKMENALIYFGPQPIIEYHGVNKTQWDMEPGFALLATFWKGKESWYEYMGHDICLEWPLWQLEEFNTISLNNRYMTTPKDYHKWLEHYFGDNYMEENLEWHWIKNAHNRRMFSELMKGGEL